MRLIDADAVIEEIKADEAESTMPIWWHNGILYGVQHIEDAPTIDAIPVSFIEAEMEWIDDQIKFILSGQSEVQDPIGPEIWMAFHSALKTIIVRWHEDNERSDLS